MPMPRASKHPYIDLDFQAGGGTLRVRILERPGRWVPPDEQEHLVEGMRRVLASLGIGDLKYGILSGDRSELDRAILTVIEDRATGAPVAFNAMIALDCTLRGVPVEVIHLGLTAVDPNFHKRGVTWILTGFTIFLLFVKNGFRPYWISNVTQVPAVIGRVCDIVANVFPSPNAGARRTFDHTVLAREIMRRHRAAFGVGEEAIFDAEQFVILNAYTGGSDHLKKQWADAARHRDERFNELCRRKLDYARGDDFLQLGQVNLYTLWRYLCHSLPREAWAVALAHYSYVLANTLVVPALEWLRPDFAMGDLRPRRIR
jgi:hypothetical protein